MNGKSTICQAAFLVNFSDIPLLRIWKSLNLSTRVYGDFFPKPCPVDMSTLIFVQLNFFIHSFIFTTSFLLQKVTGAADLGLEKPHVFQQLLVVRLAPHANRTKQDRRCHHFTWSLLDHLATL